MNTLATMITAHGGTLMIGVLAGTLVATGYFTGLSLSIEHALTSSTRGLWLAASAAIRIALLLLLGWLVAEQLGPLAALGYGLAFLLVRKIMIHRARQQIAQEIG